MQFAEEDEEDPYFDALVDARVIDTPSDDHEPLTFASINPTPRSAYAILRKEAQDDLSKLEQDYKSKFESTKHALDELRTAKISKEKLKSELENELHEIQSKLVKCEAETASIGKSIVKINKKKCENKYYLIIIYFFRC